MRALLISLFGNPWPRILAACVVNFVLDPCIRRGEYVQHTLRVGLGEKSDPVYMQALY